MKARLFTLLVLVMSMTMVPAFNAQGKGSNAGATATASQTYYYVVVGSFSNLNEAKFYNDNAPGDVEWRGVFVTTSKGRTLYRVCDGCYTSKSSAQSHANEIRRLWGIDAWVWASKGKARHIYG
ncbi:MAG: SPOR domain-containing protein [Muribaculaceae bacterium]|nr:SPOR domain-containing protein [Muribaculaceae bacterium]